MNNPVVEIARLLLEFEIERQQKAAAASEVSQAQDATAASLPPGKNKQQRNFKMKAAPKQTG